MMYLRNRPDILEELGTDKYGNRVHKDTGDYVVIIASSKEPTEHKLVTMIKVNNEWLPKQMELDFG